MDTPQEHRLLTTPEAAKYLGMSTRTLEYWRGVGGGPQYRKIHNYFVRYEVAALEDWITTHPKHWSTSEHPVRGGKVTPLRRTQDG